MLHRDPAAHVSLDDPPAVADLLDSLRKAGAQEQVTALAGRRRPRLPRRPRQHKRLLYSLREAGAQEQATALAERLPGAGMFEVFREQEGRRDRFRFRAGGRWQPGRAMGLGRPGLMAYAHVGIVQPGHDAPRIHDRFGLTRP